MITHLRTPCAPAPTAANDYALVRPAPPPQRLDVSEAFHAAQSDVARQARERASFRATRRAFAEQARAERRRQFTWLASALAFAIAAAAVYLHAAAPMVQP